MESNSTKRQVMFVVILTLCFVLKKFTKGCLYRTRPRLGDVREGMV